MWVALGDGRVRARHWLGNEHIARRPLVDTDYQLQLVSESEGVLSRPVLSYG